MNDQLKVAIEALQAEIEQKEREIILPLKQAANQLCKVMNIDPVYNLSEGSGVASTKPKSPWRIDHFFNKPLSPSVVTILAWNRDSGGDGPLSVDDIYAHLVNGGYKFEGGTGTEENQKRALKIALVKNTAQFAKIGENLFGLRTWYGMRAARNGKRSDGEDSVADANGEAENASTATEENPTVEKAE